MMCVCLDSGDTFCRTKSRTLCCALAFFGFMDKVCFSERLLLGRCAFYLVAFPIRWMCVSVEHNVFVY